MPIPVELANQIMTIVTQETWLSLHTASPGPVGGSELSGNGYRRQRAAMEAPSDGAVRNSAVVLFPMLPGATVTHVGVWDGEDDGRLFWVAQLAQPQGFNTNDSFFFEARALEFGFPVMEG